MGKIIIDEIKILWVDIDSLGKLWSLDFIWKWWTNNRRKVLRDLPRTISVARNMIQRQRINRRQESTQRLTYGETYAFLRRLGTGLAQSCEQPKYVLSDSYTYSYVESWRPEYNASFCSLTRWCRQSCWLHLPGVHTKWDLTYCTRPPNWSIRFTSQRKQKPFEVKSHKLLTEG